jgi:hypothetical protein
MADAKTKHEKTLDKIADMLRAGIEELLVRREKGGLNTTDATRLRENIDRYCIVMNTILKVKESDPKTCMIQE